METIDEVGKNILLKIYQPFEKVCGNKWRHIEKRTVECPNTEFDLSTSVHWSEISEIDDGYIIEENSCKVYIWDTRTGVVSVGFNEEGECGEKGESAYKLITQNVFLKEIFFKKGLCPSHIVVVKVSSSSCYFDECSNTEEQVSIFCFSEKNKKDILKTYN